MITAREASRIYEEVKKKEEAIEKETKKIENLIIQACKNGENFCEVDYLSFEIRNTLKVNGFLLNQYPDGNGETYWKISW